MLSANINGITIADFVSAFAELLDQGFAPIDVYYATQMDFIDLPEYSVLSSPDLIMTIDGIDRTINPMPDLRGSILGMRVFEKDINVIVAHDRLSETPYARFTPIPYAKTVTYTFEPWTPESWAEQLAAKDPAKSYVLYVAPSDVQAYLTHALMDPDFVAGEVFSLYSSQSLPNTVPQKIGTLDGIAAYSEFMLPAAQRNYLHTQLRTAI